MRKKSEYVKFTVTDSLAEGGRRNTSTKPKKVGKRLVSKRTADQILASAIASQAVEGRVASAKAQDVCKQMLEKRITGAEAINSIKAQHSHNFGK